MIKNFFKKHSKGIVHLLLLGMVLYGAGRLYFQMTAGFSLSNITQDLAKEPNHALASPSENELLVMEGLFQKPFQYLGKGCQSYVFESENGEYVIKFLKFQRFRPQNYLYALSFIPQVAQHIKKKEEVKREKLDALLTSWKIANASLKEETGLIYLHLNASEFFQHPIILKDKLGFKYEINPDQTVFLLQKKATMLCTTLHQWMEKNQREKVSAFLHQLLTTLLYEYERGFGDNDHALMQNTGVLNGKPIHIDVGQFSEDNRFKDPTVYKSELFSKTFKFRIWLSKHYPDVEEELSQLLYEIIGPEMEGMKPHLKTVDEGA